MLNKISYNYVSKSQQNIDSELPWIRRLSKLSKVLNILWLMLLLFIVLAIFAIVTNDPARNITFYNLPGGATNGEWSAWVVEQERFGAESIDQLARISEYVVRAQIVSVSTEVVRIGSRSHPTPYVYSRYQLEVIQVYQGINSMLAGNTIDIVQKYKTSISPETYARRDASNITSRMSYIRLPLEVGDDLVLFLNFVEYFNIADGELINTLTNIWQFNTIQQFRLT